MDKKGRMLLHTCCGPCASASVERLIEDGWAVDLFFSNSNIFPGDEYLKRLEGAVRTAEYFGVRCLEDSYQHEQWLKVISGLENEPERGKRCLQCFNYSLKRTSKKAAEEGYDGFATSLTISPHKPAGAIFEIGKTTANFIEYDFKKRNGFKRSIELSKEMGLYRQSYCGCEFSMRS